MEMGITIIMVEGGPEINTNCLKEKLLGQVVLTVNQIYVGGMHDVRPLQLNLLNPPILRNM
jgi:riboflavin biosynthesis pyrimidine reductase